MCSVFDCDSWQRSALRFPLPEDTDRRLKWVQFLFEVNEQRFKESSCGDITICIEHFEEDCFFKAFPAGTVRLRSGAIPSLRTRAEPEVVNEKQMMETGVDECEDQAQDEPEQVIASAPESSVPSVSAEAFVSEYCQSLKQVRNLELISDKIALLQNQENYIVNQQQLLQLFPPKCPCCDSEVKFEKLTFGVLIVINLLCPQCAYRRQWKNQVNCTVPENRPLPGGEDVTSQIKEMVSTNRNNRVSEVTVSFDEDEDSSSDMESVGEVCPDSDEDWTPLDDLLEVESDEGTDSSDDVLIASADGRLCTDCGKFYYIRKQHKCQHILKPYPCNICGKRFVTETLLNHHGKVHDGTYQHLCKYCYVTFRTKADKLDHENTHADQEKPFKCPDCSETFATFKERKIHLVDHHGRPKFKCDICGMQFVRAELLQRHLLVHTGAKPFKCSICQRSFNQASNLKSHVRLHKGERPFKCQQCQKSFNNNVSLKKHVLKCHSVNSDSELKDLNIARGSRAPTQSQSENERECIAGVVRRTTVPIFKRKSSVRPMGRPKRSALNSSVLTIEKEDQF